ncbi:unnamed protein product [Heterobilharzia americana]|nr:unnamed protein product [Heterobilharzia americana]
MDGHGELMHPHHRFIGFWKDGMVIGKGRYVFPNSGCQQIGEYLATAAMTDEKLPEDEDSKIIPRWKATLIEPLSEEAKQIGITPTLVEDKGREIKTLEVDGSEMKQVADDEVEDNKVDRLEDVDHTEVEGNPEDTGKTDNEDDDDDVGTTVNNNEEEESEVMKPEAAADEEQDDQEEDNDI